ncbi:MAG: YraN family protein [Spirochaetaceae bacterium]|nr:YraN family protein [Spirochaetaceae bacterium]
MKKKLPLSAPTHLTTPNNHNKLIGNDGEKKACHFLTKNNYEIISRNWRKRIGEIDIIALQKDVIVFVEVKTYPRGTCSALNYSLNKRKQKKIIETSKYFLNLFRQYNEHYIRYDVILVDFPQFEPIHHIENAFIEDEN